MRGEISNRIPTWDSTRSSLYQTYNKKIPVIRNLPNSRIPDLAAIPENLQITLESRQDAENAPVVCMLHCSAPEDSLLLIFGTPQALEVLHRSAHWVCDGTFKYCPRGFYQVYSIHRFLAGEAAPLTIALMSNKLQVCNGKTQCM